MFGRVILKREGRRGFGRVLLKRLMIRLLPNRFGIIGKYLERERQTDRQKETERRRRGFGRVLLKRLMIRLLPNSFGMIGKFLEREREREGGRFGRVSTKLPSPSLSLSAEFS